MVFPVNAVTNLSQGFPQIKAPFVNTDDTINQVWLQLLIALWNRTGLGPGASTPDALALATAQPNEVATALALAPEHLESLLAFPALKQQIDALESILFLAGSPSVAPSAATGFSFFIGGLMTASEPLGGGVFAKPTTFPAVSPPPDIITLIAATVDSVLTITTTVAGVETTVANLTFLAGAFTGTLVWTPASYTVPVGALLRMYGPAVADASLSYLAGLVPGST